MRQSQLRAKLERELDQEIQRNEQALKDAQKTQRLLQEQDREIHARGTSATGNEVQRIDAEIDGLRRQIEDGERHLVATERHYSQVRSQRDTVGKLLVGLSEAELANLEKLSSSYQAFAPHLSAGLDSGPVAHGKICPWSACWTCSEACGGCSGCGQACSQHNACVARQE